MRFFTVVVWKTLILFFALFCVRLEAGQLTAFRSDECSVFPEGTLQQQKLWRDCCVEHDKAYWAGGTFQQRLVADQALKSCVEAEGKPAIAMIMMLGVRLGGAPLLPTSFRWGYGWPYPRPYGALSQEEQSLVKAGLQRYERENAK